MIVDAEVAHAAVEARDKRFDGLFFTGVTSTGIYCRCVCPAKTPKPANRRFFPTAAAAEMAGFRPCLICRPERAPGQAPIDAADRLAHAALQRIEAGALEEASLEDIAADLGVTDRHLRRVMIDVFGAPPIQLAQTHRLLAAKRLLAETDLPIAEIAFASGFKSLRRFNALFAERYRLAPSCVRKRNGRPRPQSLTLRLEARGALNPARIIFDMSRRQVAGVEIGHGARWLRTLAVGEHAGWIGIAPDEGGIALEVSEGLFPAVRQVVAAARGAFDLDSDIATICGGLAELGAPARLPGALDPFEQAIRAVLGQQIGLAQAGVLGARLTAKFGATIETPHAALTHLFPTPARLADASMDSIAALGMPRKRAETVLGVARAAAGGKLSLARGAVHAGREALSALPGIGPWTLEYIALRGLGDPDAFPIGDAGLRAAFTGDLAKISETWHPWRGYAAAMIWARTPVETREAA
jgi:AraC family transcriptional regulator of adaptative response / DNA-3-methyladenine glycosylase II